MSASPWPLIPPVGSVFGTQFPLIWDSFRPHHQHLAGVWSLLISWLSFLLGLLAFPLSDPVLRRFLSGTFLCISLYHLAPGSLPLLSILPSRPQGADGGDHEEVKAYRRELEGQLAPMART